MSSPFKSSYETASSSNEWPELASETASSSAFMPMSDSAKLGPEKDGKEKDGLDAG
jgi:hypothetical protein